MSFKIFALENEIKIHTIIPHDEFPETFMNELEKFIREKAYINNVTREERKISFWAPPFRFAWNGWNLFNPVTRACMELKEHSYGFDLKYKFVFMEFFVYAILFSLLALFPALPSAGWKAGYLVLVWVIYFFNILWPKPRFEKYIETTVEKLDTAYLEKLKKLKGNAEG